MTNKQLLKDSLGWGFILWLIGYVLGIILFLILPAYLIGWFIIERINIGVFLLWIGILAIVILRTEKGPGKVIFQFER